VSRTRTGALIGLATGLPAGGAACMPARRRSTAPGATRFVSTHPGAPERLCEQEALVATATTPGRRHAARFQQAMARIQER
jgi:hypothetical protein